MNNIHYSNVFQKDIKLIKKRGRNINKLKTIIVLLERGKTLLAKNKDHALITNYKGYRECHIEPDWLLIYKVKDGILFLARSGSHADLF